LSVEPLTDDLQQTTHGKQGKGAAQINQGSLVGQWRQDYKSLCAAVTTFATLVDPKLDFLYFDPGDLEK